MAAATSVSVSAPEPTTATHHYFNFLPGKLGKKAEVCGGQWDMSFLKLARAATASPSCPFWTGNSVTDAAGFKSSLAARDSVRLHNEEVEEGNESEDAPDGVQVLFSCLKCWLHQSNLLVMTATLCFLSALGEPGSIASLMEHGTLEGAGCLGDEDKEELENAMNEEEREAELKEREQASGKKETAGKQRGSSRVIPKFKFLQTRLRCVARPARPMQWSSAYWFPKRSGSTTCVMPVPPSGLDLNSRIVAEVPPIVNLCSLTRGPVK
jgi:hypothetical protein